MFFLQGSKFPKFRVGLVDAVFRTEPVRRGEGEFPLDFGGAGAVAPGEQPEPEAAPAAEQARQEAETLSPKP